MNPTQRNMIATAAYLVAAILLGFFFGRPFWNWAMWNESSGTFDFGIVKITTRPPFPGDVKSVLVGLVLPTLLAAFAKIIAAGGRK
jgi:hypothetical protein